MLATASSQAIQSRPSVPSFASRFGLHLFLMESVRSNVRSVAQGGRFWGTLPCPSGWEGGAEWGCGYSRRITLFLVKGSVVLSCLRLGCFSCENASRVFWPVSTLVSSEAFCLQTSTLWTDRKNSMESATTSGYRTPPPPTHARTRIAQAVGVLPSLFSAFFIIVNATRQPSFLFRTRIPIASKQIFFFAFLPPKCTFVM